jgi:RNA polymerase sigma factor (sigma-70 family)
LLEVAIARRELQRAIRQLTPEQTELIKAIFFDEVKPAEYARQRCISSSAIYQQLNRALKKLRKFLR